MRACALVTALAAALAVRAASAAPAYAEAQWALVGEPLQSPWGTSFADNASRTPCCLDELPSARAVSFALQFSNATGERLRDSESPRGLNSLHTAFSFLVCFDMVETNRGGNESASFPISVPEGDPWFDPHALGGQELPMRQAEADEHGRGALNYASGWIDGGVIYGHTEEWSDTLREFEGGRLLLRADDGMPPWESDEYRGTHMGMAAPYGDSVPLMRAGAPSANAMPAVIALVAVFMREHNRLCAALAEENPGWDDGTLYWEARWRVTSLLQRIAYYEYMPAMFGTVWDYTDFDPDLDPAVSDAFAFIGSRYSHSEISDTVLRFVEGYEEAPTGHMPTAQVAFAPELAFDCGLECVLRGAAHQHQRLVDTVMSDFMSHGALRDPTRFVAPQVDVLAADIQRARVEGVPPLSAFGGDYDLTWDADQLATLRALYGSEDRVEAAVAALVRDDDSTVPTLPPLMADIMKAAFVNARDSDPYYFLRNASDSVVADVFETKLADVIVRNTDIDEMSTNAFFYESQAAADANDSATDWGTEYLGYDESQLFDDHFRVSYSLSADGGTMSFLLQNTLGGWMGVGQPASASAHAMIEADIVMGWFSATTGAVTIKDCFVPGPGIGVPEFDENLGPGGEDSIDEGYTGGFDASTGVYWMAFSRAARTGDEWDYDWTPGVTPVITAYQFAGDASGYHGPTRGRLTLDIVGAAGDSSGDGDGGLDAFIFVAAPFIVVFGLLLAVMSAVVLRDVSARRKRKQVEARGVKEDALQQVARFMGGSVSQLPAAVPASTAGGFHSVPVNVEVLQASRGEVLLRRQVNPARGRVLVSSLPPGSGSGAEAKPEPEPEPAPKTAPQATQVTRQARATTAAQIDAWVNNPLGPTAGRTVTRSQSVLRRRASVQAKSNFLKRLLRFRAHAHPEVRLTRAAMFAWRAQLGHHFRASDEPSLLQRRAFPLFHSRLYQNAFLKATILAHLSLAVWEPGFAGDEDSIGEGQRIGVLCLEACILCVYFVDILVRGWLEGGSTFLVPFKAIYVAIASAMAVDVLINFAMPTLRFSRPLRGAVLVCQTRRMRDMFKNLYLSAGRVLEVVAGTLALILVWALFGMAQFGGLYPSGLEEDGFESLGQAFKSLFTLLSLENYPDILYPAMHAKPWAVVFFGSYIMLGAYVLMNVQVAVIFKTYQMIWIDDELSRGVHREFNLLSVFHEIDVDGSGAVDAEEWESLARVLRPRAPAGRIFREHASDEDPDGSNQRHQQPQLDESAFVAALDDLFAWRPDHSLDPLWLREELRGPLEDALASVGFTWLRRAIILGNVALLCADPHAVGAEETLARVDDGFALLFVLEMAAVLLARGWRRALQQSKFVRFDLALCLLTAVVPFAAHVALGARWGTLRLLRAGRVVTVSAGTKHAAGFLARTLPVLRDTVAIVVVSIYVYACIGAELYHGLLAGACGDWFGACAPSAALPDYSNPDANFNSPSRALLTLFQVFTRSNYHEIMNATIDAAASPGGALFFFVSFYVWVVIVLSDGLMTALVVDRYESHESKAEDVVDPSHLSRVKQREVTKLQLEIDKMMAAAAVSQAAAQRSESVVRVTSKGNAPPDGPVEAWAEDDDGQDGIELVDIPIREEDDEEDSDDAEN